MASLDRRTFLKTAAASAAALGAWPLLGHGQASQPAARRPNFIFLVTDDQRWDALSVVQREQGERGRFPWIQTPNMDRLAAEGVRFRNAFVVNSLCAPSRACFLTGLYSHISGGVNNHMPLPLDLVSHATELRKAGYATGYFGKWHQGQQAERPGFEHFASFIGQGHYEDCPFVVDGQHTQTKGWVDDVSTDYAIEFIRRQKDKPFDLVLGFKSPHDPRTPPARSKDLFAGETPRPVPNLTAAAPYGSKNGGAREENLRNYFRCIKAADDNIGRILKTLDELGLAEDTVVVFAGDNGYFFGEHGRGDKRGAYEESIRIPLLLRYPRLVAKGKLIDPMVLNIDLAPTLLDLAGVAIPAGMQGQSWKPLLEGKETPWRTAFFYEYFFERGYDTPTILGVRTENAKLITYPGHDEWLELYDLKNDPYEMKNLAKEPAHADLLKQMREEFDRQAKAVNYRHPANADDPTAPGATQPRRAGKKVGARK